MALAILAGLSGALSGAVPARPQPAWAGWPVAVGSTGGGAEAGAAPAAPSGVTSACGLVGDTITVSWSAVAGASSYSVYQSTTSATAGYSLAAGGVTATSWTSPALGTASYWYEVAAVIGTSWQGPNSSGTSPLSITLSLLCL